MSRHVAKTIVAAGLAERCEVQLAYAIGVTDPVSVHVDTQGSGVVDDSRLCEVVRFLPTLTWWNYCLSRLASTHLSANRRRWTLR